MTPTPSDSEVQALALQISERSEFLQYRAFDAKQYSEWTRQLREWLAILDNLRSSSPVAYWALFGTLVVGLLAVLVYIGWSLYSALKVPPQRPVSALQVQEKSLVELARQMAEQGDYLGASHQLLLASLEYIAQRHLLILQPQDGNLKVCEKLELSTLDRSLREPLVQLVADTNHLWFGQRQGGKALYQRWQVAFRRLEREL